MLSLTVSGYRTGSSLHPYSTAHLAQRATCVFILERLDNVYGIAFISNKPIVQALLDPNKTKPRSISALLALAAVDTECSRRFQSPSPHVDHTTAAWRS